MGLLSATGRRAPLQRALRLGILALLSLGAVAMALPFALMLAGATRTGIDQHDLSPWPRFLTDREVLYRKYIEALYNESPAALRAAWETDARSFDDVALLPNPDRDRVAAWERFLSEREIPDHERRPGFVYAPSSRGRPWLVRRFLNRLREETDGSIAALNRAYHTEFPDWNAFQVLPPDTRSREGEISDTPWTRRWNRFLEREAPAWTVGVQNLTGYLHERVTRPRHGADAPRVAMDDLPAEDRELFLRGAVNPAFVRVDPAVAPQWRTYLEARHGSLEGLAQATGLRRDAWAEVPFPASLAEAGPLAADWRTWLQGWIDLRDDARHEAPTTALTVRSLDREWRALTGAPPPIREWDQLRFERNPGAIRRVFLFQNFATVAEILIRDGRGLWVTAVYCGGSVLLALLVNPLAAYALSRYRPKHTYALLLYLLLTMAFPPMVTQIPLFLLLRDLQLLNTFWALWLPGMVHGYSIFLLKGFFDSLPRDLYESAALDGAGEFRMFTTITLGLSKPILAVIALQAFVNAYTAFMFALLICQDERMWTLMVWLYQLQQTYGPGVQNAAYVLAALPTLLAFLLAQRHILKGIVIPTEK